MAVYLITVAVLIVYVVLAWLVGTWLGLSSSAAWALRLLLWLLGLIGAGAFIWFYRKNRQTSVKDVGVATDELDQRISEALRRLRAITRMPRRAFGDHPLVLVLGPAGAAKTTVIRNSGLDPDLLSGSVEQDGVVVPTRSANFFFTRQAIFVDVGGALPAADLKHLLTRLQRSRFTRAVRSAGQSPRLALVCTGCDIFQQGTQASAVQAQKFNAALRETAQILGSDCAVYVLFTKMDRLPGFTEYVQSLSKEQATQVLGVTLPLRHGGTGVYAEDETKRLTTAFDELFCSLAERRTEFLARENDPAKLGLIYEFPREVRKLRVAVVQFLVDLCRPSQMPSNPLLRGFYFCGVRPIVVEDLIAAAVAARAPAPAMGGGATRMFSFDQLAAAAPRPAVVPSASARKTPQWAFVTHLFSDVLLKDRIAMGVSGSSTKVSAMRRALLAATSMLLLVLIGLMARSYFANRGLQRTVAEAAAALPQSATAEPSPDQLRQLERLRSVLATVEQHRSEGAPLRLRWGLYSGNALYPEARKIYFSRFHALLFAVTQQRMLEALRALPITPDPAHDYTTVYATLKAYLITSSHHEKSEKGFLVPVLLNRWAANRQNDDVPADLVQKQFEFYAEQLVAENPFATASDDAAVAKARAYLRAFGDEERIYQSALAEAAKGDSITFNRLYPGSDRVILSRGVIPAAFTKAGFAAVQNRFSHLKDELGKEEWVLGGQAFAGSTADLEARLRQRYSAEFVQHWRTLLSSASVRGYAGYADAANKLEVLTTPSYPLLALFALVSDNTNVDAREIASVFQPVRAVVPPGSSTPVQSTNQPYLSVLGALQSAMKQAALAPPNDPGAAAQALSAVTGAYNAPREMAQRFEGDAVHHIDKLALDLLVQPIRLAENVVRTGPAGALNAAGQGFCAQFSRVAGKFPFNPAAAEEASLEEVDGIFGPAPGRALFDFYNGTLQKYVVRQGSQYVALGSGPVRIAPEFLRWFSSLAAFADALYPGGVQQPKLAFSLTQSGKNKFRQLSITVDGDRLSSFGGTKQFTWPGPQPGITIADRADPLITFEGRWALFRFASEANWQAGGGAAELQFRLQTNGRQQKFADGTDKIIYYELRMNNPRILQPAQLAAMRRCVARVAAVQ